MSGQMWNHIRGPPFVMTNPQTKETNWIHGSTQYQLVAETYVVGLLYALITFGFIIMNDAAEEGKPDKKKKNILSNLIPSACRFFLISLSIYCAFFFSNKAEFESDNPGSIPANDKLFQKAIFSRKCHEKDTITEK